MMSREAQSCHIHQDKERQFPQAISFVNWGHSLKVQLHDYSKKDTTWLSSIANPTKHDET